MKTKTWKKHFGYFFAFGFAVLFLVFLYAFEPMRGVSWRTPYDPVIWDGRATTWQEWAWASRYPDWFNDGLYPNAGFFYDQHKLGWQATSSSGSTAYYPGVVYFLAHDIEGEPPPSVLSMFRQRDDNDWNVAEYTFQGINVKCWVFGGDDAQVDTGWIQLSDGLQYSSLIPEVGGDNLINDAESSYIVRLNDDPATDIHWFPGDPEPGDPNWDWGQWYGFFASYGFNNSFYLTGLDPRPGYDGSNEVYEWAFYWGCPGDSINPPDEVHLPGIGIAPPVLDSLEILVLIIDPPKDTLVFVAPNWWIHFMPPFPIPGFGFNVYACQDIAAEPDQVVEVNFYMRNEGLETDSYLCNVQSKSYWRVEPSQFEITLASEEWIIYPVNVFVPPGNREEVIDTVMITVNSLGSPGLIRQDGMRIEKIINVGLTEPEKQIEDITLQVYPNPFRSNLCIHYSLPQESLVNLKIYDLAGKEIVVLENAKKDKGDYVVKLDRHDFQAGVYICRIEGVSASGAFAVSEKMVVSE